VRRDDGGYGVACGVQEARRARWLSRTRRTIAS
jgi:hypothetical protein